MKAIVPLSLQPYAEAAVTRLSYLYPSIGFVLYDDCIEVSGTGDVSTETIAKEINYALYREKVFAETLSMRRDLISGVMRR